MFDAGTQYIVTFSEVAVSNSENLRQYKTQANAWKAVQKHMSFQYGFVVFAKIEEGRCSKAVGIRCRDGAQRVLR